MTSSLLNLVFPTRFFSLSLFLLLDNPQPRKTYGEDHHHDENGVFYHRNCLSYLINNVQRPLALGGCPWSTSKAFCFFAFFSTQMRPVLERTMAQTTISYLERTMAQKNIAYLEQRYTALESEIADALRQSPTDDLAIADLKYRKLIIADEIQHNRRLVERFSERGAQ
jgi:hypothetical protein